MPDIYQPGPEVAAALDGIMGIAGQMAAVSSTEEALYYVSWVAIHSMRALEYAIADPIAYLSLISEADSPDRYEELRPQILELLSKPKEPH
jgi:hypothetical protein